MRARREPRARRRASTDRVELVLALNVVLNEHDVVQGFLELEGVLLARGEVAHGLVEARHEGGQAVVAGEAVVGRRRVVQPVAAR